MNAHHLHLFAPPEGGMMWLYGYGHGYGYDYGYGFGELPAGDDVNGSTMTTTAV